MGLRLRKGCRIIQCEFEVGGVRHSYSTGETARPAAAKFLRAKRREVELQQEAVRRMEAAAAMGRTSDPRYVLLADGGRCVAENVWKEYWETTGVETENSAALERQMQRLLEIVGPRTDLATLDDNRMDHIKKEIKKRGPQTVTRLGNQRRDPFGKRGGASKKGGPAQLLPSSVNDLMRVVYRMWNFALTKLNMKTVHRLNPSNWLEPETAETREMKLFEEAKLEAVCLRAHSELIPVYRFGIATSIRREELCTLTR